MYSACSQASHYSYYKKKKVEEEEEEEEILHEPFSVIHYNCFPVRMSKTIHPCIQARLNQNNPEPLSTIQQLILTFFHKRRQELKPRYNRP